MPHVGAHQGIPFAVVMILTGVVAGAQGAGWSGALLGVSAQALWVLPLLLLGSVDRSRLSDRLERKRAPLAQPD